MSTDVHRGPPRDEGPAVRVARSVLAGQSGVLAVVAVAGLLFTSDLPYTARSDHTVLGLGVNGLHCSVLAVTAVLGAVAAWAPRGGLRWWGVAQCVGFAALLALGTLSTADAVLAGMNLNGPDRVLHGALALLGIVYALAAKAPSASSSPRQGTPEYT